MPSQDKTLLDKWKWLGRVMSDPQLSGTAKAAAYFLADYHRNVTGLAFPSCKTLKRRIRVSLRAAQDAVRVLRKRGWIILVKQNKGPGQSNWYAINWENTIEPSQIRQHKKRVQTRKIRTVLHKMRTNLPLLIRTNLPTIPLTHSL